LRQLSIRLLTLQEEERERISRELHDEVGQLLTAVDLDLDWSIRRCPADLDALPARLGETKSLVRDALDATRELCASLRTHELERRALASSVRYYAEEFGRRTGIQVQVTAACDDELLGPEAARNVYRIFQEALSNVARHARATSVSVILRPATAGLVLSVTDDGAGFETGRVSDPLAIGLIGMRERARLIGGSLNVDSSPGKGTSITLAIPLCIAPQ